MKLSIRAYAKHKGVSDRAVRKAIQSGRITPDSKGQIDADMADSKWEEKGELIDKEVLQKDWVHANGNTMPIRVMAVDSGYATQDVYSFVRKHPQAIWGASGATPSL